MLAILLGLVRLRLSHLTALQQAENGTDALKFGLAATRKSQLQIDTRLKLQKNVDNKKYVYLYNMNAIGLNTNSIRQSIP